MNDYLAVEPSREAVEVLCGSLVLEFGAPWCGHCRAADRLIAEVLAEHPSVAHWRVEDGRGRALGRAYGVKLWPTLLFLRDGRECARLVRPGDAGELRRAIGLIDPDQLSSGFHLA